MARRLDHRLIGFGLVWAAALTLAGASACTITPLATTGDAGTGPGTGPGTDAGNAGDTSVSPDSPVGEGGPVKGPLGFTPSNVDLSGIDLTTVGAFTITGDCSINSESNLASCGDGSNVLAFKVATQSDGSKVGVYVAKSMSIPAGSSLSITGALPLVFIALETIDIAGTLNANSREDVGEAGGQTERMTGLTKGVGLGGGGAPTALTGGGGASYCGVGGAGAAESGTTTAGGATYGSAAISPLVAGSEGGTQGPGGGGAGGGAVQLVAGTSITLGAAGLVHAGAGGGGLGGTGGQGANGGGSGGSILLESAAVTIAGTLAANGGGGGGAAIGGGSGGANATGNAVPAAGGASASAGGAGSAAASIKGADGSFMPNVNAGAGAGGGGAGRIRINSTGGAANLTGATLSPAATTPCATEGKVSP